MKDWYDIELMDGFLNKSLDLENMKLVAQKVAQDQNYAQAIHLHATFLKALRIQATQELRGKIQAVAQKLSEDKFLEQTHNGIRQEISKLDSKEGLGDLLGNVQDKLTKEGFFEQVHQTIEKDQPPKSPSIIKKLRLSSYKYLAAASIVLVLLFSLNWYFSSSEPLYADYFTPYPDQISQELDLQLEGAGFGPAEKEGLERLQEGLQHYNQKAYASAVPIFEEYLLVSASDWEKQVVQFYLALSYLGNQDAQKANTLLLRLQAQFSEPLAAAVDWYLALSYLQIDQPIEAKKILASLTTNNQFGEQAKTLLEAIPT